MISVIITSFKEPKTIGKAIKSVLNQKIKSAEIIVVAPDDETLRVASKYQKIAKKIKVIKDPGEGKSVALNLAVKKANGEILVLTDGDVFAGKDSINLITDILVNNKEIGAVSGRPISTNSKGNKYGFWAYVLTEVANKRRIRALKNNRKIFCSGYLFGIRKELFPELPAGLLSEDGYISDFVYEKGFKIIYQPKSLVYVKYPDNFSDWLKQKKRSAGGYNQLRIMKKSEIRSMKKESMGFMDFFKYVNGIRSFLWIIELFIARLYMWALIYRDINVRKKTMKEIWERVESTK